MFNNSSVSAIVTKLRFERRLPIEATVRRRLFATLQENGIEATYVPLWSGKVGNSKHMQGGTRLRERTAIKFVVRQGKYLLTNPAKSCKRYKRYCQFGI